MLVIWGFAGDFTKMFVDYEINEHVITEEYKNITVVTDTADIVFVPSNASSVVCYEPQNVKHTVSVKDGTLFVELIDTRKWYEYLNVNFRNSKITVSIPSGEYDTLSVKGSTGDLEVPKGFTFEDATLTLSTGDVEFSATVLKQLTVKASTGEVDVINTAVGALDLSASTGEITVENVLCEGDAKIRVTTGKTELENLQCKHLTANADTGDITLEKVIAAGKFSIVTNTGGVKFDSADADEIFVKTTTGHVMGTLLSEKVFITQTDTGKIDVPKTISGGKCEIVTNTGDIKLSIK